MKKTPEGWVSILSKEKVRGPLTLTNERIFVGNDEVSISIQDIFDVEINTRIVDVPKIQLDCVEGSVYLEFVRQTNSHHLNLLLGDSGWAFSEVASYTAYWASLLTMAVFLYGNAEKAHARWKEERNKEKIKRAFCRRCGKYIPVDIDEGLEVWQIQCPICGRKGMTTYSPEDAQSNRARVKNIINP